MSNRIMETLETLEEKIESIKWLIRIPFRRENAAPRGISIIRKSAGILGKHFPKGAIFEKQSRRRWEDNFAQRVT